MTRSSIRLPGALAALCGALVSTPVGAAEARWSYAIGIERADQQANFCEAESDVREIAQIFRRFSPRTGYSALSDAPGCHTAVRSFTPTSLVDEVVIAKGEPNEYRIRFLRVTLSDGAVRYLVTTRDLDGH